MIQRRGLLSGAMAALAMPAIVRPGLLMPVRPFADQESIARNYENLVAYMKQALDAGPYFSPPAPQVIGAYARLDGTVILSLSDGREVNHGNIFPVAKSPSLWT